MYIAPTQGQARVIIWISNETWLDVIAGSHVNMEIKLINGHYLYKK